MLQLANDIVEIISDYHNDYGFQMSSEHVLNWVSQFDESDREFILSEFLHVLKQGIYVSKEKARTLLIRQVQKMSENYKYASPAAYLSETVFLKMQEPGKSQDILLHLLDEVLVQEFGTTLEDCGKKARKNFIYIDDVLATGRTIRLDCIKFLEGTDAHPAGNLKGMINGDIRFAVLVFCAHSWAVNNLLINLKLTFKEDLIIDRLKIYKAYLVENNLSEYQPKLNLAYPVLPQSEAVNVFLQKLQASKFADRAFRKKMQPHSETFFSSADNRTRFENIILNKGVEILVKVKNLKENQRPLGNTNSEYRTLGTGTLFFTWRNISNTCPIVFWWNNVAHDWAGLFPLHKRGQA